MKVIVYPYLLIQGTLKGIIPQQLRDLDCRIILGNTYHLGNRRVALILLIPCCLWTRERVHTTQDNYFSETLYVITVNLQIRQLLKKLTFLSSSNTMLK